MAQDSITGSVIAEKYRATGFQRSGRMGDVYVARRLDDQQVVSLKMLDPGLFANPEAVRRFEREAKIAQAIEHPFTLRVLDHGRSALGPWLALEYVDGESLADVIERGPLDPARAALITGRIALALEAAHQKGVVHRDLAPSNVILASQGGDSDIVKVSDFGLAMLNEPEGEGDESTLTGVGVRIGTPTYMAPEYIEEYSLDHRADLYGLGIMLFEMLTGAPPFTGRPYKVMDAHVNEAVPRPSSRRPGVPAWLDELVSRMTTKRPAQRLQTAAEVAAAIGQGLGQRLTVVEYAPPSPKRSSKRPEGGRPEAAPPEPAPAKDPILEHFVASNVGPTTRSRGGKIPPLERRFLVTRVAAGSVAGQAGVAAGWTLHLPDEDRPGLLEPRLWYQVVGQRRWAFFPPDGAERVEIVTSGLPIGVEVCRSAENVTANYDPLVPEPSALLDLWRQQRWEDLERLSKATLQQARPGGSLGGALFGRFLSGGAEKRVLVDHPALLFHGIAAMESGRPQGHLDVAEFAAKYATKWPNVYQSLAEFYTAAHQWRSASEPHVRAPLLETFTEVVQREPLPLLVRRYEELAGAPAPAAPWVGHAFPAYSMDAVDGASSARLADTLASMDDAQLLAVCLLGGFRCMPDSDEFLHRFANQIAFFQPFLYGLHLVTTKQEPVIDRPDVYRGEATVRASGVPFQVLHDYRALVQRAVKPPAIPTIYLIDRWGTCVHEGQLTDCDLWDAVTMAGRLRLERLRGGMR
jgi:serine/threonine protein kinase